MVEISKLFGAVFALMDDIRRLFSFLFVQAKSYWDGEGSKQTGISRSEFFSQLTMVFTFIPLAGFIYGMIKGAYRYKIHEVKLSFPEFPKGMGSLKVVQISDLHLGSFFSEHPVKKIVELVNAENPDIIVFTGDLVNNVVEEALPYKDILSKLKAGIGVFSIFGNHDYGDYVQWDSLEDKKNNLDRLVHFQRELGWDILMNENRIIEKNGEKIAIIGVENWGGNLHFPRYGKLDKAYSGTETVPFKLLLSHDPSHWDLEVSKKYSDIQLTLSGHTHGFQFGIEYGNIKFSPVQWVYKHWAGLYMAESKNNQSDGKQYLYVNRGAGFIGYPGRLGIWPEITVIEIVHG
ncbi:MAG: metallophosphoesterase [Bacteroidia bacterium]